jgi:methanogenic corrinoid protein MtbC1
MSELIEKIAACIEAGKINESTPFPPDMKGQLGADELTAQALKEGVKPQDLLNKAFIPAMERVGKKFSEKRIFVPQMLVAANAMATAMKHLKPFFNSGEIKKKGTFIIGTVAGDLHDIGKNLVSMMVEGSGWDVIDLGVDVKTDKFISTLQDKPDAVIGVSALLTTTMLQMEKTVKEIRENYPSNKILIGGAPVTQDFCDKINADFYGKDPQAAVSYLTQQL